MSGDQTRPGLDMGVEGLPGLNPLDAELAGLATDLAYPPTPDLVTAVRVALEAPATGGAWRSTRDAIARLGARLGVAPLRRSVVLALAGVLLAAGIATAAAFYALGGLRIVFVTELPSVPPAVSVKPSGSPGAELDLGRPTTMRNALGAVEFTIFQPSLPELGQPDAVYYGPLLAGGQVSFVYGPRPGLVAPPERDVSILVTEFAGAMQEKLAQKSIGPGTTVEILSVNGGLGFWIEGKPHVIVYQNPRGDYAHDSIRLVRNSLAWEQGGTVIRIEGNLSREEAFRIAASVVPVAPTP